MSVKKINSGWVSLFKENHELIKNLLSLSEPVRYSPAQSKVFNAFTSTDPTKIKMVLCLQDPYPSKPHATGWAMDVPHGKRRPTLEVFKAVGKEAGLLIDSLDPLKQDVLLLNANLSTLAGQTKGHDWREFTRQIIEYVKQVNENCIFVYLGKYAATISDTYNNENDKNELFFAHPVFNVRKRSGSAAEFTSEFFTTTAELGFDWSTYYEKWQED